MPLVKVKDNEYFDYALRRFKRSCEKAGIINEYRKREFYEKPTQEKKRKRRQLLNEKKNVFLENVIAQEDSINSRLCPYSNNFKNT